MSSKKTMPYNRCVARIWDGTVVWCIDHQLLINGIPYEHTNWYQSLWCDNLNHLGHAWREDASRGKIVCYTRKRIISINSLHGILVREKHSTNNTNYYVKMQKGLFQLVCKPRWRLFTIHYAVKAIHYTVKDMLKICHILCKKKAYTGLETSPHYGHMLADKVSSVNKEPRW